MAVDLVREVFRVYSRYNPVFFSALVKANPPVTPYLHQAEFLARVLFRQPLRVFVADEIGLGKTITAILAMERLMELGYAERVLVLVPRVLVRQWILELERFNLIPRRIERSNFRGLNEGSFSRGVYVASLDLVKRSRYRDEVQRVNWDLVIVDEAHRLSLPSTGRETLRLRFVSSISSDVKRNMLFLSATPHRGDPRDYLNRLRLLDPYLVKDFKALDRPEFHASARNVLIFRRTKIDVNNVYEGREVFPPCKVVAVVVQATGDEVEFHSRLIKFLRTKILDYHKLTGTDQRALGLLNALIFKRASSSPYAAISTMEKILAKRAALINLGRHDFLRPGKLNMKQLRLARAVLGLGFEELESDTDPDKIVEDFAESCSAYFSENDVKEMKSLVNLAKSILENDSRLSAVIDLVEQHVGSGEKVIVFTEFRDTAMHVSRILAKRLGQEKVGLLTGDDARKEDRLSNVKKWLEKPGGRVLVATDVASEGLNLQVANILINYEPPWSPVKLEQRIGRVWRLGQRREVKVYTVFLAVDSDMDVLKVLYSKLIAMGRALGKLDKPPVGEEALVIDLEQRAQLPPPVVRRGQRVSRVTEYRLRSEYLKGGEKALERLVEQIYNTIVQLQEDLKKVGGLERPDRDLIAEFMYKGTGFATVQEAKEAAGDLIRSLSRLRPDLVHEYGGDYAVKSIGGTPIPLSETWRALSALMRALGEVSLQKPVFLVAKGEAEREIRVYELSFKDVEGRVVYSEPVAVDDAGSVIRGAELLKLLSLTLRELVLEAQEFQSSEHSDDVKLRRTARDVLETLLSDYRRYRESLVKMGLRVGKDTDPFNKYTLGDPRLIGVIRFTSPGALAVEAEMSMEERRQVEQEAMRVAMEYERSRGREPVDVSQREHYDIYSRDPGTGEERFIEVKGHKGPSLLAELTEEEYRMAESQREKYWLYIVTNIGSGRPQLVAIQDPLSKMRVQQKGVIKYLLLPGEASG